MRHIAMAAVLTGCLLPKSHGLKGGETLYVAEDSQALEVMGPGLHKEDHHRYSAGKPASVVAAGATVRVAADYEQQRALNTSGSLAHRNPWILVEVVASPVAAQRGWKGWIHLDTTKQQPVTPPPIANAELARTSLLCPHADSNEYQCNVNLPAGAGVRVVGCAGPRAHVELFTAQGHFVHGFINASQLSSSHCTKG